MINLPVRAGKAIASQSTSPAEQSPLSQGAGSPKLASSGMGLAESGRREPAPAGTLHQRDDSPEASAKTLQDLAPDALDKVTLSTSLLQARIRGAQSREHIVVKPLAGGAVHIHIHGKSKVFSKVGIKGMQTRNGAKTLDLLRLPRQRFSGHVLDAATYLNTRKDDEGNSIKEGSFADLFAEKLGHALQTAYINGAYFDVTDMGITIGEAKTPGGKPLPSRPVPEKYEKRFIKVKFDDGSEITLGPVLARDMTHKQDPTRKKGKLHFTREDLENPDYQFPGRKIQPGELSHAKHPNPRSALTFPKGNGPDDAYWLAVATATGRGSKSDGFDMAEWAIVGNWMNQKNPSPSTAVNADGGYGSALGLIDGNGESLLEVSQREAPYLSTVMAFTAGETPDSKSGQ